MKKPKSMQAQIDHLTNTIKYLTRHVDGLDSRLEELELEGNAEPDDRLDDLDSRVSTLEEYETDDNDIFRQDIKADGDRIHSELIDIKDMLAKVFKVVNQYE